MQELLASGQIKQSEAAAAAEAARSRAEVLQEQLRMAEAELHQLRLSSTRDAASLEEANRQRLDATAKLKASEIVQFSHISGLTWGVLVKTCFLLHLKHHGVADSNRLLTSYSSHPAFCCAQCHMQHPATSVPPKTDWQIFSGHRAYAHPVVIVAVTPQMLLFLSIVMCLVT